MGCTSSKVDDLEAKLYSKRCDFLQEAIRQHYAFADAHVAYIHSLKGIGLSLQLIFDQDTKKSTSSPVLLVGLVQNLELIQFQPTLQIWVAKENQGIFNFQRDSNGDYVIRKRLATTSLDKEDEEMETFRQEQWMR